MDCATAVVVSVIRSSRVERGVETRYGVSDEIACTPLGALQAVARRGGAALVELAGGALGEEDLELPCRLAPAYRATCRRDCPGGFDHSGLNAGASAAAAAAVLMAGAPPTPDPGGPTTMVWTRLYQAGRRRIGLSRAGRGSSCCRGVALSRPPFPAPSESGPHLRCLRHIRAGGFPLAIFPSSAVLGHRRGLCSAARRARRASALSVGFWGRSRRAPSRLRDSRVGGELSQLAPCLVGGERRADSVSPRSAAPARSSCSPVGEQEGAARGRPGSGRAPPGRRVVRLRTRAAESEVSESAPTTIDGRGGRTAARERVYTNRQVTPPSRGGEREV